MAAACNFRQLTNMWILREFGASEVARGDAGLKKEEPKLLGPFEIAIQSLPKHRRCRQGSRDDGRDRLRQHLPERIHVPNGS